MPTPYLLDHLLENAVSASPSKEALIDVVGGHRSFDYAALYKMASHCAALLQRHNFERHDRVGIYLPKCAEEAAGIFAASMAGGVFVDINSLLLGHQVAHILNDCGVKYLITSYREWMRIRDSVMKQASLRSLLFIDQQEQELESGIPVVWNVMDGSEQPRHTNNIGEDLAGILYTSGSTGKPRGVMLSHRNLLAGSRIVCNYLQINCSERILSLLPFSFDYGLNQLLTTTQQAAAAVLFQYRFPAEIVRVLETQRITGLAGVPLIWAGLAHHTSGLTDTQLPLLRYITNSGGTVPTATVRKLRKLLPTTRIFLMYGLTEAFRSTYLPPEEVDRRPDSIGKAIPETEIMVINAEGKLAKTGELGTLVHRGPTVSLGYWGQPELTKQFFKPHPFIPLEKGGDTVCYSGDLVRMDEDGFLYFAARADAQIKSQGYRVSPAEVEQVLMETGELAQAAVIGLPAGDGGEKIHAVVVPAGTSRLNTANILRHCAHRLPAYMVPQSVEVIAALPKTPNGKIDYRSLRAARLETLQ
jgi:acyl-CoA ligase (AMP-forming) (exosortase A-associated)